MMFLFYSQSCILRAYLQIKPCHQKSKSRLGSDFGCGKVLAPCEPQGRQPLHRQERDLLGHFPSEAGDSPLITLLHPPGILLLKAEACAMAPRDLSPLSCPA